MLADLSKRIQQKVLSLLEGGEAELVGLSVKRQSRRIRVEVFVDKPSGGISLDECAAISRRIASALEEGEDIPGSYLLEVASPGIDWPLCTARDFSRVLNRKVRLLLYEPYAGKGEWTGTLQAVKGENIILDINNAQHSFSIGKIKKGVQII